MVTNRGIYNDLNESTYSYKAYGLIFYFSSEFYKKKFKLNLVEFVEKESKKLQGYYRVKNIFDSYFAIALYKRIEKRGFRVIVDDKFHKELKEDEVNFIASLI